jgi:hypothetical protein
MSSTVNRLITDTLDAVRADPRKGVVGGIAIVVLVIGLVLIARSLFGGPSIGPVSTGEQGAAAALVDESGQRPAYEPSMDPNRGQRQGNRYLAPSGR